MIFFHGLKAAAIQFKKKLSGTQFQFDPA